MNRILLLIFLAVTPLCYGGDLSWFGADKSKGPDTEYRKTENGFAGMLLVTSDTNWKEKWNTPSGSIPDFTDAETVRYGEELAVLTFFMNPKPDNRKTWMSNAASW